MALDPIPISGDYVLTLTGLSGNGSFLNAATVTYALKAPDGTTVSGGTGTMSYTAASNGVYTATVESTVTALLTAKNIYTFCVTVVQSGFNDYREGQARAYVRSLT